MSSSDDGYVHDPSGFDAEGERVSSESESDSDSDTDDRLSEPVHPDAVDRSFDWRGWVLVGVIVVAFIVAPLSILLWPPSYNYFFALLILPLLPAVLLATTAVWATTRP
ncbi:hypothetical protein [Natronoglomus mannanivorans]|uniref:Uncharacterized protein n=1 Tax=Natronoglomus mannanivorans TaxID=2979990 RepID=A0AAP2YWM3_9EURY|nr:hypothetical protein [Halobacteria archaeon AArc-xg1-1]